MARTEALGLTWAMLAPPEQDDFMNELAAGPSAEEHSSKGDLHERMGMQGWHHACFRVASVDETVAELKRRGVNVIAGPMNFDEIGRRGAFFEDAWSNMFELTQPLQR